MPRKRAPFRFDDLIESATDVFIREGFARARVDRIARQSRSASGTVYLYVAGKEALFDLSLRRALEDPTARDLEFPVPNPSRDQLLDRFGHCLHQVCHLPALWLASESQESTGSLAELQAVLHESWSWLARYRKAVLLIRASAADWPGLPLRFEREFTLETVRHWALYLEHRAPARMPRSKASASARLVVTTLAASALGLGVTGEATEQVPGALDEAAVVDALSRGLVT